MYQNHSQHLHITSVRQAVLGPVQDVVSFRIKIYWNKFPRIHCSPIASGCDNVKFWELIWMGLSYKMEKRSQEKPRLLQNIWLFQFMVVCTFLFLWGSGTSTVCGFPVLTATGQKRFLITGSFFKASQTHPAWQQDKNGEQMNEYQVIQCEYIIQRFPLNTKFTVQQLRYSCIDSPVFQWWMGISLSAS